MHLCLNCGVKGYWTIKASGRVKLTSSTNILSIRSFCSDLCRDEKEAEFIKVQKKNATKPSDSLYKKLIIYILMLKIPPLILNGIFIGIFIGLVYISHMLSS